MAVLTSNGRNPRQLFSRSSAAFGTVPFATDCHSLRPLGSITAPSFVACSDYTQLRSRYTRA
jgi:hypothetical protein